MHPTNTKFEYVLGRLGKSDWIFGKGSRDWPPVIRSMLQVIRKENRLPMFVTETSQSAWRCFASSFANYSSKNIWHKIEGFLALWMVSCLIGYLWLLHFFLAFGKPSKLASWYTIFNDSMLGKNVVISNQKLQCSLALLRKQAIIATISTPTW